MGWGVPANVGREVASPIFARALVLGSGRNITLAYVCVDICFVSSALRTRVLDRVAELGLPVRGETLMLTATHTHSSLGGFAEEVFYAASVPGFCETNTDVIVDAVVAALRDAVARVQPARVWVHQGALPESQDVAHNRSLSAFNRNLDVRPRQVAERSTAVNRQVSVLRVDATETQTPVAVLSWFGLHGTCVHADHQAIHPDHPGLTALHVEETAARLGWLGVVAIASQGAAGDVSPNDRWSHSRRRRVGPVDDDFEAAKRVGRVLGDFVVELAVNAPSHGTEIDGLARPSLEWVDMSSAPVSPTFCYGRHDCSTEAPRLGIAFAFGTAEGPGPARALRRVRTSFRRTVASLPRHWGAARSWKKLPLWTFGPGARSIVAGCIPVDSPLWRLVPDRFIRYITQSARAGGNSTLWVPRTIPSHLVRLGPLVLCGVPFEPTTTAGRRLEDVVRHGCRGATHVIICGYANGYASYMCTDEEYLQQDYEGASTLFGRWTLAAWQTVVHKQALQLSDALTPTRDKASSSTLNELGQEHQVSLPRTFLRSASSQLPSDILETPGPR